jgi:hypothetical protein
MRQRLSLLSQASLRITEDLDMETVLQGALDSARSLTGARYGVITLHDDAGVAGDFLSSGMTTEETERLWTSPGWPEHFGYLAGIAVPLRVPDLLGHLRSLGLPEMRPPVAVRRVSFPAFPLLHRGERVGSIYLAEKEGAKSSPGGPGDAGALRRPGGHGQRPPAPGGERARAGLETLVDTSPVGLTGVGNGCCHGARRRHQAVADLLHDAFHQLQPSAYG